MKTLVGDVEAKAHELLDLIRDLKLAMEEEDPEEENDQFQEVLGRLDNVIVEVEYLAEGLEL